MGTDEELATKEKLNGIRTEETAGCDTTSNTPSREKDKPDFNQETLNPSDAPPAGISWADMSDDEEEEAPGNVQRCRSGGNGAGHGGIDEEDSKSLGSSTTEERSRAGSSGRSAVLGGLHGGGGSGMLRKRDQVQSHHGRTASGLGTSGSMSLKRTDMNFSVGQGGQRGGTNNSTRNNVSGLRNKQRGGGRMGGSSSFTYSNDKVPRSGSLVNSQHSSHNGGMLSGSKNIYIRDPGKPYRLKFDVPSDFSRDDVERCFHAINIVSVDFSHRSSSSSEEKNCVIQLDDFWTYKKVLQDYQGTKFPGKTCMTIRLIQAENLPLPHSSSSTSMSAPLIISSHKNFKDVSSQNTIRTSGRMMSSQRQTSEEFQKPPNSTSTSAPTSQSNAESGTKDKPKSRRKMNLSLLTAELADEDDKNKRNPNIFGLGRPREENLHSTQKKAEDDSSRPASPPTVPQIDTSATESSHLNNVQHQNGPVHQEGTAHQPSSTGRETQTQNGPTHILERRSPGARSREDGEISSSAPTNPNIPMKNNEPYRAMEASSLHPYNETNPTIISRPPPQTTMFMGANMLPVAQMQTGGPMNSHYQTRVHPQQSAVCPSMNQANQSPLMTQPATIGIPSWNNQGHGPAVLGGGLAPQTFGQDTHQGPNMPYYADSVGQYFIPTAQNDIQRQEQALLMNRWLSSPQLAGLRANPQPYGFQPAQARFIAPNHSSNPAMYDPSRNIAAYPAMYQMNSPSIQGGSFIFHPQMSQTTRIPQCSPPQHPLNEGQGSPMLPPGQQSVWMPGTEDIYVKDLMAPFPQQLPRDRPPEDNSYNRISKPPFLPNTGSLKNRKPAPPTNWDNGTRSRQESKVRNGSNDQHLSLSMGNQLPPYEQQGGRSRREDSHDRRDISDRQTNKISSNQSPVNEMETSGVDPNMSDHDLGSNEHVVKSSVSTSEILKITQRKANDPSAASDGRGSYSSQEGGLKKKTWASIVGSAPSSNRSSKFDLK